MNYRIITVGFLFAATLARSAMISDDFNRNNTAQTANTVNVGGSGWTQAGDGSSGSDWFINSGFARGRPRASNNVMYNTGLSSFSGSGTNFTLSADVYIFNSDVWAGVAFNYTDADNMYFLRIKGDSSEYQLIEKNGGVQTIHVNANLSSGTFASDTFYTITVTSAATGDISFSIDETGAGSVLSSTDLDDTGSALANGYAGLYITGTTSAATASFDNFSLTVVPEPATMGMMGLACGVILIIRRRF